MTFQEWEAAWRRALYEEPTGFYLREEGPAGHFRTASHADPEQLSAAIARLAREHGCTGVVDVGAGRGELLRALTTTPEGAGLRLRGADVVQRPHDLPGSIGWATGLPNVPPDWWRGALVVAWELLDVVPCPVLEVEDGELKVVEVEEKTGRETLGETVTSEWAERWWPAGEEGDRVEVGATRDAFWAGLVGQADGATAVLAVDYIHDRETRPQQGSLTGFKRGRAVPPRPDGSMDITAHVAIDSVRDAVKHLGPSELTTQEKALRALGVGRGELTDPGGLGGFGWLIQHLGGRSG